MGDDDLKACLPEPPPPAPKRKEAAISEALARFDGAPATERPPRPQSAPWWKKPQVGLLATAALIATISLPFAWTAPDRTMSASDEPVSDKFRDAALPAQVDVKEQTAAVPSAKPASKVNMPTPAKDVGARADNLAPAPQPMLTPPAKPSPAPAARAEESEQIVVRAQKMSRPVADSPTAVSVISADRVAEDGNIVVTGARVGSAKSDRRGDWNACTLNDPGRALSKCRKLANRASKTVRSEAETHLSSGLAQAWNGNLAGAIAAFDQAIAIAPELSVAYLNRGLAYDRQGKDAAALSDLDKAVKYAPRSARAFYNRSVILRKQGDTRRAARDEERAISLDPDYQAIIR